jgi:hypothetical protein
MQQLRLMGLVLFITAIFLVLAAAITKTTHIRLQIPGARDASHSGGPSDSLDLPPLFEPAVDGSAAQFTSVPVVWPLIIAAGLGLLMWFMLASDPPRSFSSAKQRNRPRRN